MSCQLLDPLPSIANADPIIAPSVGLSALPAQVVFNNIALTYVGAGMCAIVGTLSPVSVPRYIAARLPWVTRVVRHRHPLALEWTSKCKL